MDEGAPAPDSATDLARVVEELRRDRDDDRALLEELQLALVAGARLSAAPPARQFPDWMTWVDEWLLTRISRSPHRYRWCLQYAEHPEVADRLEALWQAWEAAWPNLTARLGWFRDGLDHHLAVVTADDGPLRNCSAAEDVHTTS